MPAIFISYRRDDSASAAGRLADTLATRFDPGEIFRDVHAVPVGADFREVLREAVRTAQVVLVVIGRFWAVGRSSSTSRLQEPEDYVRMEIEEALAHDVHVVPVLVEGAQMPAGEAMPESIRRLAYLQAHEVLDSRWDHDVDRLVELLTRSAGLIARTRSAESAWSTAASAVRGTVAGLPADFLSLIYEPRRFLAARASAANVDVVRAAVFLAVSQFLGAFLILQAWPTRSSAMDFASSGALLLLILAFAASLPMYLSWRLAGAPRAYRRVLVILLYQCAFVGLCVSLAALVMLLVLGLVVPEAIDELARMPTVQSAARVLTALESRPTTLWVIGSLIAGLIGIGALIWLAGTWGAYALALGQSRARAWLAFALFALFFLGPVGFLVWVAAFL